MDLLTRLLDLRRREHLCTVDLLETLLECDRTRAYLDHGYESLWSFLIGAMRYSNAAASRRNKALKCARKFPVVLAWLRAERVTLCSLEAIAPLLDEFESEQALLDRIDGKSQAEVQAIVAQARPTAERREVVRREFVEKKVAAPAALFETQSEDPTAEQTLPSESALQASSSRESAPLESARPLPSPPVSSPVPAPPPSPPPPPIEERVRVSLSLTPEEFELLERARMLASRRPGRVPSVHEIVVEAARFYVEKKAPKDRAAKTPKEPAAQTPAEPPTEAANENGSPTERPAPVTASRHVPAATRDAVFLRDGERCTFVSPNGQRCPSKHHLQIDHVIPFALGGTHAPENLRVLCGAHNRRRAERTFGARGSDVELTVRE